MKFSILSGSTSKTINVFIRDSTSTTGAGLSGLVYNSAGLTAYYCLPLAASAVITLATQTVTGAWSTGGFVEIDATNMKGWYRLDLPNASIASGVFSSMHLQGATNMVPCPIELELTAWNNQNASSGGLSNLDATVSGRMATYTQPTGFLAATFPSGTVANTINITAGTITTATNLTNAPTNGDLTATMKTSVTTAASAATPVATVSGDLSATMKTSVTTACTASTPTAAAVTGAVGSVTAGVTVTTNNDKTGYALTVTPPTAATIATAVLTTAMTESYAAQGAAPTLAQAQFQTVQMLGQNSVTGTTMTVKKRDGATTAKTFTINDATNPTSIVEAT